MNSPILPVPEAYVSRFESLAYGLFVHWGLYSQIGKGEWYKKWHGVPMDEYRKLTETFTAEDFDAREHARFARRCGMRYITLTTRHHDGFSLYDTRGLNTYDAPHSAAGRDLIAEFVQACRAEDIVPFFYHTTLDWSLDTETCDEKAFAAYLDYLNDSVEILCTQYGKIGGLWFDGNWSRRDADWQEDRLYGMIRSHQPEAIIVNNSSINALGAKGHPQLDVVTYEQGRPEPLNRTGMEKYVAVEMCQTMNLHWGIGKHDFMYKSPAEVITDLASCRRVGANYLLNIGPTAGGAVPAYEKACLERVGEWVAVQAPAIYNARPTACVCEGRDFVLRDPDTRKAWYFAHNLPIHDNDHKTREAGATEGMRKIEGLDFVPARAKWLDTEESLSLENESGHLKLNCTGYPYGSNLVVRVAELT
ncbi:MAG: alpha-L-fucosidase [Verrucomicrobia bacterium]|nr:alpha-L-fucosidase [Verrucomicrobiota bacterium]MCH8513704.1 alpha-L-fucosidase [Kiritimatiellia bacterium]